MSPTVLQLPVPFRDVCAADLHLTLDLPEEEALVARTVAGLGWAMDLRILGASHQVLLRHRGSDVCSERVACHADRPGELLPPRHARERAGVRYAFRSATSRLGPAAFRATVDRLVGALAADPGAVCGVFPGDAHGMTGVQSRIRSGDAASWRSWHTYPQTGEVVVTCTAGGAVPRTGPVAAPMTQPRSISITATTTSGGRRVRACVVAVALALVAGCASVGDGASREEARAFLDATYQDDPARGNTWVSEASVDSTSDRIADEIDPRDRFSEDQAAFMRNDEYIVAVFPEPSGSRVELDDYDRIRRRYPLLIGGYWGLSPTSYGPLGERASRTGGGFRGGGPGFGK